ncbi:transcription-repair coupling factor [Cnuella takakiae]|uniref:Transcription-repair-coupling factor n=1 Tax=Cnuella takakiae TaxID=1302690 RepID=A0A1M5FK15_9BACT|nr:transcription-repair coupling factor [Cnuella takakiae]OLY93738.1 transcription-repair coupling factor [Cnuella takakiae]SHF91863.1 transcription-repair coupling factor [Cnuella takakiae]
MTTADLLNGWINTPRLFSLADRLTMSAPQNIYVKNLQGSSTQFVAAAAFLHPSCSQLNHVFVCNDAEDAAYFHNTLENLTGALNIFYFPSSFKNRKNYRLLNPSHVMLRTEALTRFSAPTGQRVGALVTYPEALFEKVVVSKAIAKNIIQVKTNDVINTDELFEKLVSFGFERTDFVYEPGQFAVRGGIIDIYSFGNEKPYRIELFGNDVDSIRIIDPETQLSERRLLQVSIIPNVDTQFEDEDKVSLLEFLPENTVVWMQDADLVKERLELEEENLQFFIELQKELQSLPPAPSGGGGGKGRRPQEEEDVAHIKPNVTLDEFTTAKEWVAQLEERHKVHFGSSPSSLPTGEGRGGAVVFNTRPQPAFNRQFDMLMADLKSWESKGFQLNLFAENPKQLERLYSIFTDLKEEITFQPIATAIHEGFIDEDLKVVCYTDHQIFQRYHKYKVKQAYNKNKALTLRALRELSPGDFVTHIDHGVGVYSGLQKIEVGGRMQEAVRLIYKDSDILYVNINSLHKIAKYTGKEGSVPKVNKLGSDAWTKLKDKTKAKVKEIAFDLIKLYAARKAQEGFKHSPDNYMYTELEASFIYEDTPDQSKAIADVKKDMESLSPMDRLVCGDVGFGKTEVAVRAAFKTCLDGKQAAVLVPTTILAFQHYKTFKDRLKDFPVTVDFINRFKTSKEKKETLQKLKEGKIDILVGTHAILAKDVQFKDLGLLIVDEEQKFGVAHKEKIKTFRTNVDALTLTATPIPRTLQFSLMGARDLSIINTPPPNRQPIQTEVKVFQEDFIRDAIYFETERGGQVFFIHNRVNGLPEMASLIQGLCPDLSVGFAHGQMEGHELEEHILDFIDKKYDVLVCTNIVESGVDIPNVNTIIINNAHQFGLSDLHQLRGRVGRSNKKAFCYLLAPPMSTLPNDSRKRLQTLEQHSELGSGFQIAMRDLDIRGAGNLLGGEQSGFMAEIGFEMYQKVLNEAIRELKRTQFKDLFKEEISKQDDFVQDCTIDTDLEILIPDSYVENITERLSLYTRLDNCETEEELEAMQAELHDRFGDVPQPVKDLFITVRCRKLAVELGFEKMSLKDDTLRCFFINRPDSPYFESDTFKAILDYVQTGTNKARLKQSGKNFLLVVEPVKGMGELLRFLQHMHKQVVGVAA